MPALGRLARARHSAAATIAASICVLAIPTAPPARSAPVPMIVPSSTALSTVTGSDPYGDFAYALAGVGDVNGDGFGDVLVSAEGWNDLRGRVELYQGLRTGIAAPPSWSLEGRQEGAFLGQAVAGAGDLNGDGFADVIVGEPGFTSGGRSSRGRARVFLGSRAGLATSAWWEIVGKTEGEALGGYLAGAGDVNGDGLADVLVGSEGATMLLLGRRGTPSRGVAWTGPPAYRFAGVADVNGDGCGDVALAGGTETLLYYGSSRGLAPDPAWRGPSALDVSGGDVNGDGLSDLALATPSYPGGAIRLFYGTPFGPGPRPDWTGNDPGFHSIYGITLAANGDVNGDGFADILVSSPNHSEELFRIVPSVFVYLGGSAGPGAAPDWRGGSGSRHSFGWCLSLGSDVDGDGSSDPIVGDPGAASSAGAVSVFRLGPGYPVPRIVNEAAASPVAEGTPIVLEAAVTDVTHRVTAVEIRYRLEEDFDFRTPIPMDPVGGDLYRGTIPASEVAGTSLVYSIRATDDYGLAGETELTGVEFYPPSSAADGGALRVRLASTAPGRPVALLFRTRRAGPARVRLYDVRGRLVGTLLDEATLPAGAHRVPLATKGASAAAGIYFYRLDSVEGRISGRFAVLR